MRTGLCTIQQALTTEAAIIVKQALALARRRNHAQVTPLHVAIALLESSSGLLKKACLKSHSHPLQCKALELCFNVSLNRLPTSTSSPFLPSSSSSSISLSNALVAAFKRAQAHQRRGSIESQQQPILALKIEIEQLVISILDDPSVSRVMREAGFTSTQVKLNVEQSISFDFAPQSLPLSIKPISQVRENDVMSVLTEFSKERKRNNVIIGENVTNAENVVRAVMDRLEKGNVNGNLKFLQFINLPLSSFKNLSKEEVEQKILDLKTLIATYLAKGVVLYLGDLKWVVEFWSNCCEQRRSHYCPVQHMIMEVRRLVCGKFDGGDKIWLMGIANFQTFMKTKEGKPSLESLWDLRPLAIPVGSLSLSLNIDSDFEAQSSRSKVSMDWSVGFEREARTKTRSDYSTTTSMSSKLPPWLQNYKIEKITKTLDDHNQENVRTGNLCEKWDSFFGYKSFNSTNSSPTFTSISSYDQKNLKLHHDQLPWPPKEHQFMISDKNNEAFESKQEKNESKPELLSNPNSSPNSTTSSETGEATEDLLMFKEFNDENLTFLSNGLEKKVPWQKEIVHEIADTVLRCRSGLRKRKENGRKFEGKIKEETWMFFLGSDKEGKLRIAKELAKIIFGSVINFISINSNSFLSSSTKADSSDEFKNKSKRDEESCFFLESFAEKLHANPHCVFYVEEVEQLDYSSQMGIKRAIKNGSLTFNGDLVSLEDAIIIFSCETLSSMSRACSPPPFIKKKIIEDGDDESVHVSLDLNIAIEDESVNDHSVSDIGIKDVVDKLIMFKSCETN